MEKNRSVKELSIMNFTFWNDGIVPYETDSVFGECDFPIHYFDNRFYPVSVIYIYTV